MTALPGALLRSLAGIVGERHVLTGDAAAGFAVDWTGRFRGHTPAVVRPGDTAEVAAVLGLCTGAGVPVVPQGGNTGLVGGGVPLHGEVVLSLTGVNGEAIWQWAFIERVSTGLFLFRLGHRQEACPYLAVADRLSESRYSTPVNGHLAIRRDRRLGGNSHQESSTPLTGAQCALAGTSNPVEERG